MKSRYQFLTLPCLLVALVFFLSAGPAFGESAEMDPRTLYAWNVGSGQAELEEGAASGGWPGVRPRYQYPPYPPYHLYPPYYYPPQYERERTWYEGDLPTSAGRLLFLVEPLQAETFINGYPLSRHADLSFEVSLLKGEHLLEVRAEGYKSYHRTIEIRGGEQIRLIIRLEREAGQ